MKKVDTQVVELLGRNLLVSELLQARLEVAIPERDRGIDLIAYQDLNPASGKFTACPVQMKASSGEGFSITRKYEKFANLIMAFVWNITDPQKSKTYAMTYPSAKNIAKEMGWTKTASWTEKGHYTTSKPSDKLKKLLQNHRMEDPEMWYELVTRISSLKQL